jgi:hypothetical protein
MNVERERECAMWIVILRNVDPDQGVSTAGSNASLELPVIEIGSPNLPLCF